MSRRFQASIERRTTSTSSWDIAPQYPEPGKGMVAARKWRARKERGVGRRASCLGGGLEDVLGVTRGDEDDPANRDLSGVPDSVARSAWDKDRAAWSHLHLAVTEKERGLAGSHVEGLVGLGVEMRRGPGLTRREHPDHRYVGPPSLVGAKRDRLLS